MKGNKSFGPRKTNWFGMGERSKQKLCNRLILIPEKEKQKQNFLFIVRSCWLGTNVGMF